MNHLWKLLTSLRLTVTLLSFGILLVFIGTVAQADEGLYQAQARYFKHWFVSGFSFFGRQVPVPLPGGYLIGTLLLINLTAAHIKRFQWSRKKLGIHLTHLGVILLLLGQLVTDLLSRETQMRILEGESRSYSESGTDYELAFVSDADASTEDVVVIPQQLLARGGELQHEKLPFTVRVKEFHPNSEPAFRAPMATNLPPPLASNGVALSFDFQPAKLTYDMNSKNVPFAVIEVTGAGGSLGTWVAAGWSGDATMAESLGRFYARQMGNKMGASIQARLTAPQSVEVNGKRYTFALRPVRAYKPYTITLLKATHTTYPGTVTAANPEGIPKDFRSRIRLQNPAKGEDREVEIYMNSPLRYAGLTFYQYQMTGEEMAAGAGVTPSSTFQVVRNPAWLTPYAGCGIVALGLIIQFMIHLVGFVSRRKTV
jgi:hypothetical protein